MADTSEDRLLLGGGICHITATQAEVKKFLLVILRTAVPNSNTLKTSKLTPKTFRLHCAQTDRH